MLCLLLCVCVRHQRLARLTAKFNEGPTFYAIDPETASIFWKPVKAQLGQYSGVGILMNHSVTSVIFKFACRPCCFWLTQFFSDLPAESFMHKYPSYVGAGRLAVQKGPLLSLTQLECAIESQADCVLVASFCTEAREENIFLSGISLDKDRRSNTRSDSYLCPCASFPGVSWHESSYI